MRLGQLSRKLSITPSAIVAFLQSKGVVVEDNANSRLGDEESKLILAHFAPGMELNEPSKDEVPEISVIESKDVTEPEKAPALPEQVEEEAVSSITPPLVEEVSEVMESEVIKAPKIELQGLKVIGKIELPSSRKKESPPQDGVAGSTEEVVPRRDKQSKPDRRPAQNDIQRSSARQRKNPIALQREREQREAEERKKAELMREKENRTQFYLQKVKSSPPARKVNLVDEPLSQLQDEAPDEPKTLWGKFVKWLTSH